MANFTRLEISRNTIIAASADDVWALLIDWSGVRRWWLTEEQGGRPGPALVRCDALEPAPGAVATRRLILETGAVFEENLLLRNDAARRIYYDFTPTAQVQNYLASACVDEMDSDHSRLTVSSRLDVAPDVNDVEAVRARFAGVYEKGIFNGFSDYFRRAGESRPSA